MVNNEILIEVLVRVVSTGVVARKLPLTHQRNYLGDTL